MNNFEYENNDEIINHAIELIIQETKRAGGAAFSEPETAARYLLLNHKQEPSETFSVMFLNSKNELIAFETMFRGSINSAQVYPRTIAVAALKHNSAALILCHHHPSLNIEPSDSDIALTGQLKKAMALIDVKILDHFILGADQYHSMAGNQLI